ncbi:MAG: hypothetical protein IH956_08260 [Chloroflexi bacterium]|nr:hypothetical protein [Chloroflexota bacterium]
MADLSKEQVLELARAAGLRLDDVRAETIAARLTSVLSGLDGLPDEVMDTVGPLPVFTVGPEGQDD